MLELLKSGEGKKNWRLGGNNERFGIIVIIYMFQCNINNFKPFSCNQKDYPAKINKDSRPVGNAFQTIQEVKLLTRTKWSKIKY